MLSMLRRVSCMSVAMTLTVAILFQFGCGGTSPFLAAQFASTIGNIPRTGPPSTDDDDDDDGGDNQVLASVCDLTSDAQQTINVSIQNQAQQRVRFAMTFLVSAGPNGFVCDEELTNYTNAGYSQAFAPGSASSLTIGCDTVQLLSGNTILRMNFGVDQLPEEFLQPNQTGDQGGNVPTLQLRRRDNGLEFIPLPELIVFGNANVNFTCVGNDLCTQRGFVYSSINNVPIGKSADAAHIQGTVCESQLGTAPEWRLDRTLNDNLIQPFQYPVGATIVVQVLDRSGDSLNDPRNQVVWTVTNAANATVQTPQP